MVMGRPSWLSMFAVDDAPDPRFNHDGTITPWKRVEGNVRVLTDHLFADIFIPLNCQERRILWRLWSPAKRQREVREPSFFTAQYPFFARPQSRVSLNSKETQFVLPVERSGLYSISDQWVRRGFLCQIHPILRPNWVGAIIFNSN